MARRTRLTRPYPVNTLEEVLPIAETIQRASGGQPVPTELLAGSLGTTLKSSAFVQRLGSSAKYGITIGSHTSEQISLTTLGESLTAPRDPEEKVNALRTAARQPDVFGRFYELHTGKPLPEIPYASNTLVREMGVNQELTEECLRIIRANGLLTGIVSERSGSLVVDADEIEDEDHEPDDLHTFGESESSTGENLRSRDDAFVLILSADSDPVAQEIEDLIGTLSVPVRAAEIEPLVSPVISPAISTNLRSARGCVIVWPEAHRVEEQRQIIPSTWMTYGAASFQLGDRVVVITDRSDQPELADSPGVMVVDRRSDGEMFRELMAAMVRTSIVQISFG